MKKYAGIYSLIILLIVSFAWGQTVTNPYPIPFSYLDTDTALTANSDTKVPSQKAIKTYVGSASTTGSANSLKSPATTGLLTATGMGAGTTRAKTVRDADDTILELGGSYTPSATWNWTSATVTWPTFNQSTTGTAAHGTTWGPYAGISGPTQARTFTLPDAAATLLYDGKASGAFGTASSATGSVLLYNSGNANAFTLQPGATGAALSWTLPTAAPGGNNYLLNAQTTGALGYTDPATFSPVAGSASIATVGTVTLGTWNSTRVASAYGGTPGITVGESGYTTFAGAVATLNSAGTNTRLTLPTTLNEAISSNLTSNSNIGISQLKGANLTINTGITLTINGPYDGDLSQKFTCQAAGSESLTNGTLTTASDKWTAANECTFAGNNATWSYVAGGASTLTQAQADLTIAGVGSHRYAFTYTVSGATASPAAYITTAFALTSTALDLTDGTHTTYFQAAVSPTDFVITSTLTAGQAFTLDGLSLAQDAGKVVFSAGVVKKVYPQWWGAIGDGVVDDTIAFQKCLNSAAAIQITPNTNFKIVTTLMMNQYNVIEGSGYSSVITQATPYTVGISGNDDIAIKNFRLVGNNTSTIWPNTSHGINCPAIYSRINIEDMWVESWGCNGIAPGTDTNIRRVKISGCVNEGMICAGDNLYIDDLQVDDCDGWALDINCSNVNANGIRISNCGIYTGVAANDSGAIAITGDSTSGGITNINLSNIAISGSTANCIFMISNSKPISFVKLDGVAISDFDSQLPSGPVAGIVLFNGSGSNDMIRNIDIINPFIQNVTSLQDATPNFYGEGIRGWNISNLSIINPKIKNTTGTGIDISNGGGLTNKNVQIISPIVDTWQANIAILLQGDQLHVTSPIIINPANTLSGWLLFLSDVTNSTITGGSLYGETTGHVGLRVSGTVSGNIINGVNVKNCLTGLEYYGSGPTTITNCDLSGNTVKATIAYSVGMTIQNNPGYNPTGSQSAPGVPTSGVELVNPFPFGCTVCVSGGVVSQVELGLSGATVATGLTSNQSYFVPVNSAIKLTYSVTPSWVWIGN